jgi:hypothetical protein
MNNDREKTRKEELERFFALRPEVLPLFAAIEKLIKSLGTVEMNITKSQISFGTRYKFAWLWLPRDWDKRHSENCLVLTFGLNHHLEDERIVQAVNPYPNRWTHHIIIRDTADLDQAVLKWLREAYDFSKNHRINSNR